jgi:hypothetical protein
MKEFHDVTVFHRPDDMIDSGWGMIPWRQWCEKTLERIRRKGEDIKIQEAKMTGKDHHGNVIEETYIGIVSDTQLQGANAGYQFGRSETGVDLTTLTPDD